jgi:isocitrate/isopropylmalate dehydrogenase
VKYYPGADSPLKNPAGIDCVILRESSEGIYPPREGDISLLTKVLPDYRDERAGRTFADYGPGKFAIRVVSEKGTQRIARFACELALKRKQTGHPGKVTCATKSIMLKQTCGLFARLMEEEVRKHPELSYEHLFIDTITAQLLRRPKEFDLIVTSNIFGDILSDEAVELIGGNRFTSDSFLGGRVVYFAPAETLSSTPVKDINYTSAFLAASVMLAHLKMDAEALALEKAVAKEFAEGEYNTGNQATLATVKEFARAILRRIK